MTSIRLASPPAPIALVVATLIALAVAPIVVSRLQAGPRVRMDRVMEAQVAVNDMQEALASDGGSDARVREDARSLVAGTRGLDAAAEREAALIDTLVERTGALAASRATVAADSRKLEERLNTVAFAARTELFRESQWNRIVPALLVPLALVSVVLVWCVARRAMADAAAAEAGRRAYARAMEEKAALARGVTHDLKNPLSAALGYAHLLREGIYGPDDDDRRVEPLERIERLVRAALTTVNDLLDSARADADVDAPAQTDVVDLDALVRAMADDYGPSAAAAGLVLRAEPAGGGTLAPTDGHRVRRIVENLVSNAIKYTPAGGTIALHVRPHDEGWVITVSDTGAGIPVALRERIFDEFFRAPGAAAHGAGIGLASSRRIARGLGGDLTMRARREGGSVFELRLPASRPAPEADADDDQTLGGTTLSIRRPVLDGRVDGPSAA